jgi:hypothetical protein
MWLKDGAQEVHSHSQVGPLQVNCWNR